MRLRVRDSWHPHINGDKSPWVYSDHKNFEGLESFLVWVSVHNGGKLDGVEVVEVTGSPVEKCQECGGESGRHFLNCSVWKKVKG